MIKVKNNSVLDIGAYQRIFQTMIECLPYKAKLE